MQVRFLPIHEPISFLRFSCSGRYGEHIRERETGVLETVWLENQNWLSISTRKWVLHWEKAVSNIQKRFRTIIGSIPICRLRTVRFRLNSRGQVRRGVPGRNGTDCVKSDDDSWLTYGRDPAVGQGSSAWQGGRKTVKDSILIGEFSPVGNRKMGMYRYRREYENYHFARVVT